MHNIKWTQDRFYVTSTKYLLRYSHVSLQFMPYSTLMGNLLDLATLDWHPGFAYCLSSLIPIIMILMLIYCRWYNIEWSKILELIGLACDISRNSTPFNNRVPLKPSFRCLGNDFTLKSNLECDVSRY